MKAKTVPKTDKAREDVEQAVAAMIRQSSEEGRIIAEAEILVAAGNQGLLSSTPEKQPGELKKILSGLVKKISDLNALKAPDGSRRFYSEQFITEAYAAILLQKQGDPQQLIAEIVRENSRIYPRPVPLDLFTLLPFDLEEQNVMDFIGQMAENKVYKDIVLISTSNRHMPPCLPSGSM
jgi:hypothetical protein